MNEHKIIVRIILLSITLNLFICAIGFTGNFSDLKESFSILMWGIFSCVDSTLILIGVLIHSYKKKNDAKNRAIAVNCASLKSANIDMKASIEKLYSLYDELFLSHEKLKENEERYKLMCDAANDGFWEVKENKLYFSERWYDIVGYTEQEIEEMGSWQELVHTEDICSALVSEEKLKCLQTPYFNGEFRMRSKDGSYKYIMGRGKIIVDVNGLTKSMAGSITDVTDIKKQQDILQHLAYHDILTDMPNGLALYEWASKEFSVFPYSRYAILFIDIDDFKYINDTLGHSFGDQLLRVVGRTLMRYTDNTCHIYRLGGDEFIFILNDIENQAEAEEFAGRILEELKKPFVIEDSCLYITTSIGIALYPEHGNNIDELMKSADISMYYSKKTGKKTYAVFNENMMDEFNARVFIEKGLRSALTNEEFIINYQPQIDIRTNKVAGFEALLRWNSKEFGLVPPDKFISIAEETHLINEIGDWVLKKACCFIKEIHMQGYEDLTIAINISMIQLVQKDFADKVLNILSTCDLDPHFLELEITESILMESYEMIKDKLMLFREKGIKIALDDFGRGYSSLSYLKQLPITTLKIDKSFIDNISTDMESASLTALIIMIGQRMGLNIIAEGVESQEQMDYLIENNCHMVQGYYFSKPMPEDRISEFLSKE